MLLRGQLLSLGHPARAELKKLEESAGGGADAAPAKSAALDAGCTSVVVAVRDKTIVCANAGDSRAVLCRAGKVRRSGRNMFLPPDHDCPS